MIAKIFLSGEKTSSILSQIFEASNLLFEFGYTDFSTD